MLRITFVTMMMTVAATGFAAAQDAAAGEKTFLVCRACHQVGPNARNAVGPVPTVWLAVKSGTYPDYQYSDANKNSGIVWTPEELAKYLASPQAVVLHTKMIFPGLKDQKQKQKDVIAYLDSWSGRTKETVAQGHRHLSHGPVRAVACSRHRVRGARGRTDLLTLPHSRGVRPLMLRSFRGVRRDLVP